MLWSIQVGGPADGSSVPAAEVRAAVETRRAADVRAHRADPMTRAGLAPLDVHVLEPPDDAKPEERDRIEADARARRAAAEQFDVAVAAVEDLAKTMTGDVSVSISGRVGEGQDSVSISVTALA